MASLKMRVCYGISIVLLINIFVKALSGYVTEDLFVVFFLQYLVDLT